MVRLLRLLLGGGSAILRMGGCVTQRLFNSNNFATLAEVCALPSAILVLCSSLPPDSTSVEKPVHDVTSTYFIFGPARAMGPVLQ